jgi:hypothetical protein
MLITLSSLQADRVKIMTDPEEKPERNLLVIKLALKGSRNDATL